MKLAIASYMHRYRVNFDYDLVWRHAKWERRRCFQGNRICKCWVSGLRTGHRLIPRTLTLYVIIIPVQGARMSASARALARVRVVAGASQGRGSCDFIVLGEGFLDVCGLRTGKGVKKAAVAEQFRLDTTVSRLWSRPIELLAIEK